MTMKKIKVDYRRDVYVYHTVLENQDLEYWESKIDLEKKNNPKGTTDHESFSSVMAWRTDSYLHYKDKDYHPLVKDITSHIDKVSKDEYDLPAKFVAMNFWACSYNRGEFAHKHNHWPSVFSGAFYVNVGDNPSPIIFEDITCVTPQNGSLMIWPAYLDHDVTPSACDRKLFSFNFEVKQGK